MKTRVKRRRFNTPSIADFFEGSHHHSLDWSPCLRKNNGLSKDSAGLNVDVLLISDFY